jgi:hypothetical protein
MFLPVLGAIRVPRLGRGRARTTPIVLAGMLTWTTTLETLPRRA